jgi:hypothetical protein
MWFLLGFLVGINLGKINMHMNIVRRLEEADAEGKSLKDMIKDLSGDENKEQKDEAGK